MSQLRPFFCFYGGKWRAAPKYPAPEHATIVEPFAGAAGYSTRYADRRVVLVEKDPIIAGIWRFLIRARAGEIRALPAQVDHVDDVKTCAEARHLIGFWLNKGSAGPCKTPGAWMRAGTHPRSYWGSEIRERIASQLPAIRHWRIIEGDYGCAPDRAATWFVDPPYEAQGKHYRCSDVDYRRLARWCRRLVGQVIVCESVGATWLPFRPFQRLKANESRHGGKVSDEAVYLRRSAA